MSSTAHREALEQRRDELKRKLNARRRNPAFKQNIKAIEAEIRKLDEAISSLA